jgi:hypothetical protein
MLEVEVEVLLMLKCNPFHQVLLIVDDINNVISSLFFGEGDHCYNN